MGVVQIRKQIQANVGPVTSAAIDLTGVAPIPGELVMIFVAPLRISNRELYSVVDFPEPVGPVTRMIPCGRRISW